MDRTYMRVVTAGGRTWRIIANDHAVTNLMLDDGSESCSGNGVTDLAASELEEYLTGKRTVFDVSVEPSGTPFQLLVWNTLRKIPYGQTCSYGEIARIIGKPRAARAVGQAVGKNPVLMMIPCHRVLGKDQTLTGFSAGLDLKIQLLDLEHIGFVL